MVSVMIHAGMKITNIAERYKISVSGLCIFFSRNAFYLYDPNKSLKIAFYCLNDLVRVSKPLLKYF